MHARLDDCAHFATRAAAHPVNTTWFAAIRTTPDEDGEGAVYDLGILDFGLARTTVLDSRGEFIVTQDRDVVAREYRAPEVHFKHGETRAYGPAIDMWAFGVILAEVAHQPAHSASLPTNCFSSVSGTEVNPWVYSCAHVQSHARNHTLLINHTPPNTCHPPPDAVVVCGC
jgi:serine/threonine protein kinase